MNLIRNISLPAVLIVLSLLFLSLLLRMAIPGSWEEAVRRNPDGSHSLSESWSEAIEEKKDKIRNHELYKLVAKKDGMYICKHCPIQKFFLYQGETYRFGTTGNGKSGRGYSQAWLARKQLHYIHINFGDEAAIKAEQADSIGSYVLHPENLRRPKPGTSKSKKYWYRLVLPPGNNNLN